MLRMLVEQKPEVGGRPVSRSYGQKHVDGSPKIAETSMSERAASLRNSPNDVRHGRQTGAVRGDYNGGMKRDAAQILKEALGLPATDRAAIADMLFASVDAHVDADAEAAWASETDPIRQRWASMAGGRQGVHG
jgi:hypothetical protein